MPGFIDSSRMEEAIGEHVLSPAEVKDIMFGVE
jgi:hypothetical protein